MENERLQARLQTAKAKAETLKLPPPSSAVQLQDSSGLVQSAQAQPSSLPYAQPGQSYSFSFPSQPSTSRNYESMPYHSYENTVPFSLGVATSGATGSQSQEEDAEGSGDSSLPRKKVECLDHCEKCIILT